MQYPTIVKYETTEQFKYLWLKYVRAFNLLVHCARCLVGEYSTRVHPDRSRIDGPVCLDEFPPAPYYYLCGVTTPYRYADNLHLAFIQADGEVLEYNDGRTVIVIQNARRIDIPALQSYDLETYGHLAEYNTCRNWRFAYSIVHKIRQENQQTQMPME